MTSTFRAVRGAELVKLVTLSSLSLFTAVTGRVETQHTVSFCPVPYKTLYFPTNILKT